MSKKSNSEEVALQCLICPKVPTVRELSEFSESACPNNGITSVLNGFISICSCFRCPKK